MAIKDVTFVKDENNNDIEVGSVNVRIDNEIKKLSIKEIDKLPTYFIIDELNDTALYDDIVLKASLYDIEDNRIETGVVIVSLSTEDKTKLLYSQQISIDKDIQLLIPNNYKNGKYAITLEYNGDKYHKETDITKNININKRRIQCQFSQPQYYCYAGETITIEGTLTDVKNHQPIRYCSIYYSFNNDIYEVTTNNNGIFECEIDIPEHGTECNGKNTSYIFFTNMENESYYLKKTKVMIYVTKEDTYLNIQSREEMTVEGTVLTNDDYVQFGTVKASILNNTIEKEGEVYNGAFRIPFDFTEIVNELESNVTNNMYDCTIQYKTRIELSLNENNIIVGDSFTVDATVIDSNDKLVKHGAVDFRLINENSKQVYRYITELDNGGSARFIFFTSKSGKYKVKAYYSTIKDLGYKKSENEISVEVGEDGV